MGVPARTVYDMALAIMHESDDDNSYIERSPAILNTLIGRCWRFSEEHEYGKHSTWTPITSIDDDIEGLDRTLCLSALPYGLAAQLYLDEDPVRSNSYWGVFQEQVDMCSRSPKAIEPIEDVYGGLGKNDYARW